MRMQRNGLLHFDRVQKRSDRIASIFVRDTLCPVHAKDRKRELNLLVTYGAVAWELALALPRLTRVPPSFKRKELGVEDPKLAPL